MWWFSECILELDILGNIHVAGILVVPVLNVCVCDVVLLKKSVPAYPSYMHCFSEQFS